MKTPEFEPDVYNDENETMFSMKELREICNGFAGELVLKYNGSDATGFWDYLKKSRFNDRIRLNSKNKNNG
jgi:hypothetical protein